MPHNSIRTWARASWMARCSSLDTSAAMRTLAILSARLFRYFSVSAVGAVGVVWGDVCSVWGVRLMVETASKPPSQRSATQRSTGPSHHTYRR